jgi:hypothetical protein
MKKTDNFDIENTRETKFYFAEMSGTNVRFCAQNLSRQMVCFVTDFQHCPANLLSAIQMRNIKKVKTKKNERGENYVCRINVEQNYY